MGSAARPALERWRAFWFDEIPPYSYALLRIVLGAVGAVTIVGAWNPAFWQLSGIIHLTGGWGLTPWFISHGLGDIVGLVLRWALLVGFVCLAVGLWTPVASLGMFLGSGGMIWWNVVPFSGAQQLLHNLTFPLVLADCGAVWSVDAWLRARRGHDERVDTQPIWPLRLWQFQLALMYFSAALWKFGNPDWRSGTALYYVLNNPTYQRFPGVTPTWMFGATVALTYLTLAWELAFPFLVWFRRLRPAMLLIGVALHLGMWTTIEVGAFTPTVLAAYIAFLDPWRTESRLRWLFKPKVAAVEEALANS
jgi:vitamin K-dependent gamma-carboxylase-like protein